MADASSSPDGPGWPTRSATLSADALRGRERVSMDAMYEVRNYLTPTYRYAETTGEWAVNMEERPISEHPSFRGYEWPMVNQRRDILQGTAVIRDTEESIDPTTGHYRYWFRALWYAPFPTGRDEHSFRGPSGDIDYVAHTSNLEPLEFHVGIQFVARPPGEVIAREVWLKIKDDVERTVLTRWPEMYARVTDGTVSEWRLRTDEPNLPHPDSMEGHRRRIAAEMQTQAYRQLVSGIYQRATRGDFVDEPTPFTLADLRRRIEQLDRAGAVSPLRQAEEVREIPIPVENPGPWHSEIYDSDTGDSHTEHHDHCPVCGEGTPLSDEDGSCVECDFQVGVGV